MLPFIPQKTVFIIFGENIGVEPIAEVLAFTVLFIMAYYRIRKEKLSMNNKEFFFLFFTIIIGAFFFGRLGYFVQRGGGIKEVIFFFDPNIPGLISWGMIFGGLISILLYVVLRLKKNIKIFTTVLDAFALNIGIPIALLRVGCLMNGHIIGTRTNLPWAINQNNISSHPVALYLSISSLLIFLILHNFFGEEYNHDRKKGRRFSGEILLWFALLYSSSSFILGFLRIDEQKILLGLSISQIISLIIILLVLETMQPSYKQKKLVYFPNFRKIFSL